MKKVKRDPEKVKLAKEMILHYKEWGNTVVMDKSELEKMFRWLRKRSLKAEREVLHRPYNLPLKEGG